MQTNQFSLDSVNLKKELPIALVIGAGLAILSAVVGFLGGIWGLASLVAWAYVGIRYTNAAMANTQKPALLNVAINAAILAALAGLTNDIVFWVIEGIGFQGFLGFSPISLYFVEAGIIGGLVALGWFAYKTSSK